MGYTEFSFTEENMREFIKKINREDVILVNEANKFRFAVPNKNETKIKFVDNGEIIDVKSTSFHAKKVNYSDTRLEIIKSYSKVNYSDTRLEIIKSYSLEDESIRAVNLSIFSESLKYLKKDVKTETQEDLKNIYDIAVKEFSPTIFESFWLPKNLTGIDEDYCDCIMQLRISNELTWCGLYSDYIDSDVLLEWQNCINTLEQSQIDIKKCYNRTREIEQDF